VIATYLHVPVKGVVKGRKGGEGILGVPGSIGVEGDGGVKLIGGSIGGLLVDGGGEV
jgi:hypothetical protein